jgi:hypothetical protein
MTLSAAYAGAWAKTNGSATENAYVPLTFARGGGLSVRLEPRDRCDGRGDDNREGRARPPLPPLQMLARAYPRETQEMVFDAHERAFAFFRGACGRGIYDNMKTAVETIFVGKDRRYNRRFLQMCSHHLVEPVACTPASGWEKGQVENQVGLVRERFFTPRLRFKSSTN